MPENGNTQSVIKMQNKGKLSVKLLQRRTYVSSLGTVEGKMNKGGDEE